MTSASIFKGKKKGLERLEGAKGYHDFYFNAMALV